jgi:hypothetical protein
MFPTIVEYNQSINSISSDTFKSLRGLSFIPSRTIPVKIYSYGAGSFAVVFKAKDGLSEFAIRCFISAEQENIDRYRNIDIYLKSISATWITKIDFLQNEIKVKGIFYPIIKMDWIEGELLNDYITRVLHNNSSLAELQTEIINVSTSLESLQIGHGDIQCGNIIIAKNDHKKYVIKLIDYDGMFIPQFTNKKNLEKGRSEFQHPNRSQFQFDEKIDRFSFWVILCAIEALKYDKTLWLEVMQGGFNSLDNLLFHGDDFKYFTNSKLVGRLYALNQPSLNYYLGKLNQFCNASPEKVDFPVLFDTSNLKSFLEVETISNSSTSDLLIVSNPSGAAVLTSTFYRLGFTPLKVNREENVDKTLIIAYGIQLERVVISRSQTIVSITFPQTVTEQVPVEYALPDRPIEITTKIEIPSTIPTVQSSVTTKSDNSISMLVLFVLIISVVVVLAVYMMPSSAASETINSDTTVVPIVTVDSTTLTPPVAVEISPKVTIQPEIENNYNNSSNSNSTSSKDALNYTALETVELFLKLLSKGDINDAWNITYNPTWEAKGKSWFVSPDGFGGIIKLYVLKVHAISRNDDKAIIFADYYVEDSNNEPLCYKQNITVTKYSYESFPTTKWMITKVRNMQKPYPCELVDE